MRISLVDSSGRMSASFLVQELENALKARAASLLTPFTLGDEVKCSVYGDGKSWLPALLSDVSNQYLQPNVSPYISFFTGKITSIRESKPDDIYTVCLDNWKLAGGQSVHSHVTVFGMTKKVPCPISLHLSIYIHISLS